MFVARQAYGVCCGNLLELLAQLHASGNSSAFGFDRSSGLAGQEEIKEVMVVISADPRTAHEPLVPLRLQQSCQGDTESRVFCTRF